jgi:hypothetical protein
VIINSHNFTPSKLYPSLQDASIGYYARLDTGAEALDQFTADESQDGALSGGMSRVDDGGFAYRFVATSSQFIQLPAITMPTDEMTIAAWVKITASRATLFSFSSLDANSRAWNVGTTGSRVPYFQIPTNSGYWFSSGSPTALTAGAWTHLGFTFNRSTSTAKIYVNGTDVTPAQSGASTATWTTPVGNPVIGRSLTIYSDTLIDDWYFSNTRALSATEMGYLASQRGAAYA